MIPRLRRGLVGLPARLKYVRQCHGITQRQFGQQIGVCHQTVSEWEGGMMIPDLTNLVVLIQTFGVDASWLLGVEDGGLRR